MVNHPLYRPFTLTSTKSTNTASPADCHSFRSRANSRVLAALAYNPQPMKISSMRPSNYSE